MIIMMGGTTMKATTTGSLGGKLELLNNAIATERDVLVKLDLIQQRIDVRKAIAIQARTN